MRPADSCLLPCFASYIFLLVEHYQLLRIPLYLVMICDFCLFTVSYLPLTTHCFMCTVTMFKLDHIPTHRPTEAPRLSPTQVYIPAPPRCTFPGENRQPIVPQLPSQSERVFRVSMKESMLQAYLASSIRIPVREQMRLDRGADSSSFLNWVVGPQSKKQDYIRAGIEGTLSGLAGPAKKNNPKAITGLDQVRARC